MNDLALFLLTLVSTLLCIALLGLIAGFSPTLYITQIAITTKVKKSTPYVIAIMAGVIVAILLLLVLFQFVTRETLMTIIGDSVRAVTVSVAFNLIIGTLFICIGVRYLQPKTTHRSKTPQLGRIGGLGSIFGLGFFRTFASFSSITATYIAGNIIARASHGFIENTLFTFLFIVATIIPFIAIILSLQSGSRHLLRLSDSLGSRLKKLNYRRMIGVVAVGLGISIIVFNSALALFF